MQPLEAGQPLPPLREELVIERAAPLVTGAASWVLYDPVAHRYFELNHRAIQILSAWSSGTVGALRAAFRRDRGSTIDDMELTGILKFLTANRLIEMSGRGAAQQLADQRNAARQGIGHWLTHKYLFFRIPLVRPQRFLESTWPLVSPLFGRGFTIFILLAGLLGLYLTGRQWDAFLAQARAFISLDGVIAYALAMGAVKGIHELGHAYQAIQRGVRVPVMGVAFLMMFPVLYSDVSDAWRLRRRRDKLMIDAGGVLAELSVAVIATLIWAFLPDGGVRSAFFALATTSWIMSLAINLNPFMRFDGYYFLADATGVQNLQPRSFALARWRLREALFGLGDRPPEEVPEGLRRFMILYAYATWAYRLVLYLGIALLVYTLFFKALGLALFLVEIVFLIGKPIWKELMVWRGMCRRIIRRPRAWLSFGVLFATIALLAIPLPVMVTAPAVLEAERTAPLYPPRAGRVIAVMLPEDGQVTAGDLLYTFDATEIEAEIEQTRLRLGLIEKRLERAGSSEDDRSQVLVLTRSRTLEQERLAGLERERARATLRAPIDGVLRDLNGSVDPGSWVGGTTLLGRIVDPASSRVRGYLAEADLHRLGHDAAGDFVADNPEFGTIPVSGPRVSNLPVARLDLAYLASTNQGPITVDQEEDGSLTPTSSWHPLAAEVVSHAAPDQDIVGVLHFTTAPESLGARALTQIAAVLIREFEF
ncbi:MAG: HlyD family efflux transporter periplasmic adaptor subunit [Pseudomonadota bacterium]